MNGYELSRNWYDFAFENPDIVNVTQGALYMWLVEANNRAGFAEKFAFNTEDACRAIGVANRKTVWKALNELVEIGFVRIVVKSSNQNRPSVLSLKVSKKNTSGALDKSLISLSKIRTSEGTANGQAREQRGNSAETAHGHSNKPQTLNQEHYTIDDLKKQFESFRIKFKGSKRGLDTEFSNFQKKHKDWQQVAPKLESLLDAMTLKRNADAAKGLFVPDWPNLATFINNRRWEEAEELGVSASRKIIGYAPTFCQDAYHKGHHVILSKRPIYEGDALPVSFHTIEQIAQIEKEQQAYEQNGTH